MKVLTLDIETQPNLAYVWDMWNANPGSNLKMVKEFGRVICFSGKLLDDFEVRYHSDFHDGHKRMVRKAHELLDYCDVVVTYNGKAFDIKHLNREFLLQGLTPPSPYKHIDLYQVIKGKFKFASNKLDHVASQLEIGSKLKHAGFDLWIECMNGNIDSWDKMREYNMQDVVLTEELYLKLRPWIDTHPNINSYSEDEVEGCTRCGSMDYQKRGTYATSYGVKQQYWCKNCGGWFTHKLSDRLTEFRSV